MRKGFVIAGVVVLVIGLVIGVIPKPITTTKTDSETLHEGKIKWYYGSFWELLDGDKIKVRFECEEPEDRIVVFIATESKWNAKKLEITPGEMEVFELANSGTIEWECTEGGAYVLVVVPISGWPVPYSIEMEKTSTYPELNYVGYAIAAVGAIIVVAGIVKKAPPPPMPPSPPPVAAPPPPAAPPTVPPVKKYCIKCGAVMPVDATFCTECGAAQ